MAYEIKEVTTKPVLERLELVVDGEEIASARPLGSSSWRVILNGSLPLEALSEAIARETLKWLGERLSHDPAVINGPDELDRVEPGVIWRTAYNGGNQYRRRPDGKWEYTTPDDDGYWTRCSDGVPYQMVYPLTAMRDDH